MEQAEAVPSEYVDRLAGHANFQLCSAMRLPKPWTLREDALLEIIRSLASAVEQLSGHKMQIDTRYAPSHSPVNAIEEQASIAYAKIVESDGMTQ